LDGIETMPMGAACRDCRKKQEDSHVRTLLLAAACAAISSPALAGTVYEVDLVNTAQSSIVSLEVARTGSDHFRKVTFVKAPALANGESVTARIREGGGGCLRDLRIGLADGSVVTHRRLDVCRDLRGADRNT
jgi:hypothetical protein